MSPESMPVRRAHRGHDGAPVLVGREELEAHRLHARARGAAEADVPLERRLEPFLEQQAERDVERGDERDGRRERGVELRLRLARPLPVEVEARRATRSPRARPRRRRTRPSPGGVISAFCEPETTTSSPHASVSHGTAPRLETASTTTSAPASFAAAASAWTSATTPVEVSDCTNQTAFASRSREPRAHVVRRRASRPRRSGGGRRRRRSAAVIAAQRSPKLPGRDDEMRLARRDEVRDGRLERAGARGGEEQHVAAPCGRPRAAARGSARRPAGSRGCGGGRPARPSAASTCGGTGVGPGVNRYLLPATAPPG